MILPGNVIPVVPKPGFYHLRVNLWRLITDGHLTRRGLQWLTACLCIFSELCVARDQDRIAVFTRWYCHGEIFTDPYRM